MIFKHFYTTNMRSKGSVLKRRFQGMNREIIKFSKCLSILCIGVVAIAMVLTSIAFAEIDNSGTSSVNEAEVVHIETPIQVSPPLKGQIRIAAMFSERVHPVTGEKKFHRGVDFALKEGTDVLACFDGLVSDAGYDSDKGNYVVIKNGNMESGYMHLKEFNVSVGDWVKRGQVIGQGGNTGMSSGAHLHMELKVNGDYADAMMYFMCDTINEDINMAVAKYMFKNYRGINYNISEIKLEKAFIAYVTLEDGREISMIMQGYSGIWGMRVMSELAGHYVFLEPVE